MVDAPDAAFHQREEAFDGVRMHVTGDVHFRGVVDALVFIPPLQDAVVDRKLVGIDGRLRKHPLAHVLQQRRPFDVGNVKGNDFAAALDNSKTGTFLVPRPRLPLGAR